MTAIKLVVLDESVICSDAAGSGVVVGAGLDAPPGFALVIGFTVPPGFAVVVGLDVATGLAVTPGLAVITGFAEFSVFAVVAGVMAVVLMTVTGVLVVAQRTEAAAPGSSHAPQTLFLFPHLAGFVLCSSSQKVDR